MGQAVGGVEVQQVQEGEERMPGGFPGTDE
jgi:hypothetical protein